MTDQTTIRADRLPDYVNHRTIRKLFDETGKCIRYNPRKTPYEEISCLYPTYGKTFMNWEFQYNLKHVYWWMEDHQWFPVVAIAGYFAMIYYGQLYFAQRKPWNLRGPMAVWNLFLSVFSTFGFVRMTFHLLHLGFMNTWLENACDDPETTIGSGTTGMWGQLWLISKPFEFIDTFFLIVHKRPVIFLHWFHHTTAFAFTYYGYTLEGGVDAGWYAAMNYGVHMVMYFYYFLMTIKCKPKWFNPKWITAAQIVQMYVGLFLVFRNFYIHYLVQPEKCNTLSLGKLMLAFLPYIAFAVLFVQFYMWRFQKEGMYGKRKVKAQ